MKARPDENWSSLPWLLVLIFLAVLLIVTIIHESTAHAQTITKDSIKFEFKGTPVANRVQHVTCSQSLKVSGVTAHCRVKPSEADGYVVKVAGSQVGAILIDEDCQAKANLAGVVCKAGQSMELDVPPTVSGSDISITLGLQP